jgi:hypothetical protein
MSKRSINYFRRMMNVSLFHLPAFFFEEAHDIILKAWTKERFSHPGKVRTVRKRGSANDGA